MNIYVASTNNIKVQGVKNILEPLGYHVLSYDVSSDVSSQPKTRLETIQGAINRAKHLPNDSLRIGLEAGVELIDNRLFLINYGVLLDGDDIYIAGGDIITLPSILIDPIYNEGLELSDAMNKYFNQEDIKHKGGAISYFTSGMVKRIEIFERITKLLYGKYLYQRGE